MKKEKSLLLAVGTSIAALAMAFTISSCSGDNGKDGADGKPGEAGQPGTGKDGANCTVTPVADGYSIKCGDQAAVTVKNGDPGENCKITGAEDDKMIICDGKSIGVCLAGLYDPKEATCDKGTIIPFDAACLVEDGFDYAEATHYCMMTNTAKAKVIAKKCGTATPNNYGTGTTDYNANKYCEAYVSSTVQYREGDASGYKCGKINENEWQGQYCVKNEDGDDDADQIGTHCDFTEIGKESSIVLANLTDYYCRKASNTAWVQGSDANPTHKCTDGTTGGRTNDGKWKGEYCYANKKTVMCDFTSEDAAAVVEFTQVGHYCQQNTKNGVFTLGISYCKEDGGYIADITNITPSTTEGAAHLPINKATFNPITGKWENGFNAGYCAAVDPEDGSTTATEYEISYSYCNEAAGFVETRNGTTYVAGDATMNEVEAGSVSGYKGQYCQVVSDEYGDKTYAVSTVYCYQAKVTSGGADADEFAACDYGETTFTTCVAESILNWTGGNEINPLKATQINPFKNDGTGFGANGNYCKESTSGGITQCANGEYPNSDVSCDGITS